MMPLQNKKVKLTLLGKGDPKLKFIPNVLVNFVMKHVSMHFLKRIMKIFKEVNESQNNQWKIAIENNPEFYNWLKTKLELYHKYN